MQTVKAARRKDTKLPWMFRCVEGAAEGSIGNESVCLGALAEPPLRNEITAWVGATNFELEVSSLRLKIRRGDWRSLDLALRLACFLISWNMQYLPTAEPKCLDCTAKVCTNFPEWLVCVDLKGGL